MYVYINTDPTHNLPNYCDHIFATEGLLAKFAKIKTAQKLWVAELSLTMEDKAVLESPKGMLTDKHMHCKNDWITLTQFGYLSCKSSIVLCNSGNQKQVEVIQTFLQCGCSKSTSGYPIPTHTRTAVPESLKYQSSSGLIPLSFGGGFMPEGLCGIMLITYT